MMSQSNDVKYKDYFDIDENFYPEVTEDLIKRGEVKWQSYYPHETFIHLLNKTHDVLSGKDRRSLWVEGAYGTGKSHAALAVKCMLEAPDDEIRDYFNEFGLDPDLAQKLITDKNTNNLVTVHRISSSSILSDGDLIWAIQDSVEKALKERGIEIRNDSMKATILEWLKDSDNKEYFEKRLTSSKLGLNYGVGSVDWIINTLENSDDLELVFNTLRDVVTVAKETGLTFMFKNINDLTDWLKSIIEENKISILFVWDEFSEYFENNKNKITGFQTLAELSAAYPFYFLIVTHQGKALFSDGESRKKIYDRFVGGKTISIELPENTAFRLMAKAMKKTEDANLKAEWDKYKFDLNMRLGSVRSVLIEDSKKNAAGGKKTQFKSSDLEDIVPMHPYAALLLKHMAVAFQSNARSMFDFIKNNDKDDAKGFKSYIEEYGPLSDRNLLAIDMLWDFFSGKNRGNLNDEARRILEYYNIINENKLTPDQRRVLKTVLLLAAVSSNVAGVELLRPNEFNIEFAFEGLENWEKGKARNIARRLCEQGYILEIPGSKDANREYMIARSNADEGQLQAKIEEIISKSRTANLVEQSAAVSATELSEPVKARFDILPATADNFRQQKAKLENNLASNKFGALITFAKNEAEVTALNKLIAEAVSNPNNNLIYIESLTPMGDMRFNEYVEHYANYEVHIKSDKVLSRKYGSLATDKLSSWKADIADGAFKLYTPGNVNGERLPGNRALDDKLAEINRIKYHFGLEQYPVTDVMFKASQLMQGARSGINQKTEGAFKSTGKTDLKQNLKDAWEIPEYWKDPEKSFVTIVRIKNRVDEIIREKFASPSGRASITEIFEILEDEPFGFLPNNLSAFVLGFVLKEYATPDYFWSDGTTAEAMSPDKMASAIANAIKQKNNPSGKFKEDYIVAMSETQRKFLELSSEVFNISPEKCGSVESARDNIRSAMRKLSFPLWCAEYALSDIDLKTSVQILSETIELYCALANNINADKRSESDIADKIGSLYMKNPGLSSDLKKIATSDKTRRGMAEYIKQYKRGRLYNLAEEIKDNGDYVERLKDKFNADAANWVWNKGTADDKISEVILDYEIIAETNKVLRRSASLREALARWLEIIKNIKIPYEALKDEAEGFKNLARHLILIARDNDLKDRDKQNFYDALLSEKENFINFYKDQYPYFNKVNELFLEDLEDEYKAEFFAKIKGGQYAKSSGEYFTYIQNELENFKKCLLKTQLNELWFNKTGTKNPNEWSQKYLTPILCMVDEKDFNEARKCFAVINQQTASDSEIKKAVEFLEYAAFFERLRDPEERDKRFMKQIAGDYSVMLKDPNLIRAELKDRIPGYAYDWIFNPAVERYVKNMAEKQYKLKGADDAKSVIETMDAESLRHYLNALIADNMTVGIEILKNK